MYYINLSDSPYQWSCFRSSNIAFLPAYWLDVISSKTFLFPAYKSLPFLTSPAPTQIFQVFFPTLYSFWLWKQYHQNYSLSFFHLLLFLYMFFKSFLSLIFKYFCFNFLLLASSPPLLVLYIPEFLKAENLLSKL